MATFLKNNRVGDQSSGLRGRSKKKQKSDRYFYSRSHPTWLMVCPPTPRQPYCYIFIYLVHANLPERWSRHAQTDSPLSRPVRVSWPTVPFEPTTHHPAPLHLSQMTDAVVKRLEAVAAKLEAFAGSVSSGSSSAGSSAPSAAGPSARVQAYDAFYAAHVQPFLDAANAVEGSKIVVR